MVTSGEAGIDGMAPEECRAGARGRAGRVGAGGGGADAWSSSACPTACWSTAWRCAPSSPASYAASGRRSSSPATSATPGAAATSTRPTTSRSGAPSSTRCATPATAGCSPTSSSTASSRGAGSGEVWAFGSPEATHARRHDGHLRRRRGLARGARGVHRGPGLGGLRPPGVPRGHGPPHRPAPRRPPRRPLRGVPDGLGRLGRPGSWRALSTRRPGTCGHSQTTDRALGRPPRPRARRRPGRRVAHGPATVSAYNT